MTNGYSLDTNVLSAIMAGEHEPTRKAQTTLNVSTTAIAAGELLYGAYKKQVSPKLLPRVLDLLAEFPLYYLSPASPSIWGRIKASLQSSGITIPDNDLWIAAIALEHDFTVVTRDAHFDFIEGLQVERW